MSVIYDNAESALIEDAGKIKGDSQSHYCLFFHLSKLHENYRSDYQIKIAVNILTDLFRGLSYKVYVCKDSDIFVIFNSSNRSLLEKSIFQTRYLFMDDPLAYNEDGFENENFCSVYDLEFQWKEFFSACNRKSAAIPEPAESLQASETGNKYENIHPTQLKLFTSTHLTQIENTLKNIDITNALRSQPICASVKGKPLKSLFEETYVNISHLRKMLNVDIDLLSNKLFFKYITEILDKRVLYLLVANAQTLFNLPLSLNLNVKTLLAEEFATFDSMLSPKMKQSVIIELQISDIFEDLRRFEIASRAIKKLGYRICIDGLDSHSFIQINRDKLNCDLIKLQWDPEMVKEINNENNQNLAKAVKESNSNRVILTRCDNDDAVEYGYSIGISLFQGRHFDKILNPEATVVN